MVVGFGSIGVLLQFVLVLLGHSTAKDLTTVFLGVLTVLFAWKSAPPETMFTPHMVHGMARAVVELLNATHGTLPPLSLPGSPAAPDLSVEQDGEEDEPQQAKRKRGVGPHALAVLLLLSAVACAGF